MKWIVTLQSLRYNLILYLPWMTQTSKTPWIKGWTLWLIFTHLGARHVLFSSPNSRRLLEKPWKKALTSLLQRLMSATIRLWRKGLESILIQDFYFFPVMELVQAGTVLPRLVRRRTILLRGLSLNVLQCPSYVSIQAISTLHPRLRCIFKNFNNKACRYTPKLQKIYKKMSSQIHG